MGYKTLLGRELCISNRGASLVYPLYITKENDDPVRADRPGNI